MSIDMAKQILLTRAIKKLNDDCDPQPMLEEVEMQLSYIKSRIQRTILLINRALVLKEMGQLDDAERIFTEMDIEKNITLI